MLQTTKSSPKIDLLFLIIIAFLAAALSGYGQATNYISAGLLLFIIPACLNAPRQKGAKELFALVAFIAFYVCTSILNYSSLYYLVGTCIMYTLVTFGPYFINIYVDRSRDASYKKKLFKWATLIWFLIVFISIKTYSGSEEGGRDFASQHRGYILGGGYGAAYASAILAVICFNYFLSGKKRMSKKAKILLLVGFILSAMHVFYTLSTITMAAMVLGCVLSIFLHGSKAKKLKFRTILFSVVCIALCIFFIIDSENVGLWMINTGAKIENEVLSTRFAEVGRLLYAEEESHHVGNRLYTLRVSWQTFLSNPLIGIGYKYGNNYTSLYQNGVGVHSEFLDSLAKFGIIGSIPYLYFFYSQIKSLAKKSLYRIAIPVIATFLIMFVFNPFLSVQTIFMLCLYLPLLIELIEKQSEIGTV